MKYVNLQKFSEERLRKDYINQHSRFIHSSWLLLEDLDREVELYGRKFRIAGLWDVQGYKKIILLQNLENLNGSYAHTHSEEVARALGYTTFRNLVTGKEITYNLADEAKVKEWLNKRKISETPVEQPEEITEDLDTEIDEDVVEKEELDDDGVVLDRDNEYVDNEDGDEEKIDDDPLIRALRIDEDDSGWIDGVDED